MTVEEEEESGVHLLEDDIEDQENEPPNKRRRTSHESFYVGSIIRVSLKNFVTYTSAEFFPGPKMNFVIGPNGSGKSTIVCAICLGLGFPPTVLGRATAVGDFVQHGHGQAEIEIELAKENNESVVIKRRIKREKNASNYLIDGKSATLAGVQELMKSFNIQVDNLCQFLPQDKVATFAQLSPVQLLHETQRAVGGDEMVRHWEHLCALRAEERTLQQGVQNDTKTLTNLNQRQNAARVEVERVERRKEVANRIDDLKIRIPIAKYIAARRDVTNIKRQRETAKAEVNRLQTENLPMKARADAYQARFNQAKSNHETLEKHDYQRLLEKIRVQCERTPDFDDKANEFQTEIQNIKKARTTRNKTIESMKAEIGKLERSVQKAQSVVDNISPEAVEQMNARIGELNKRRNQLRQQLTTLDIQNQDLAAEQDAIKERGQERENALKSITSIRNRRLAKWQKSDDIIEKQAARVVEWLRYEGGQERFQQHIFDPPGLLIGVSDKSVAAQVETCLRKGDLMTFTCLCQSDWKLFNKLIIDNGARLFDKRPFIYGVEISQVPIPASPCSTEKLKSLGFDYWVSDVLTGPQEVITTLIHKAQIHAIGLARKDLTNDQKRDVAEFTLDTPKGKVNAIDKYVSGRTHYAFSRSRYGNRRLNTTTNAVKQATFLADTVDTTRQKQLEDEVDELKKAWANLARQIKANEQEKEQIEKERNELDEQKTHIEAQRKEMIKAQQNLSKTKTTLASKKRELETELSKPDTTDSDLARVAEEQKRHVTERVKYAIALESYAQDALELADKVAIAKLKCIQAEADHLQLQAEAGAATLEYQNASAEYGRLDEELNNMKKVAADLYKITIQVFEAAGKTSDEGSELFRQTTESNESVQDLETQLEEENSALRLLQQQSGVGIIEAYEKRAKEIKEIEQRMSDRQAQIDEIAGQIKHHRSVWEPRLTIMIQRVSKAFGEAFKSISCVGEVLLSKTGSSHNNHEDDFEKWEIQIMVQFRETEKMQLLTGNRQSGGERSVSTIFYLMALQEMARAPFRVVDEINQGMDPKNERFVHKRMVETACKTGRYFLITPKLLPNLEYDRDMKILTINNGKFVPQALDVDGIIQLARAKQQVS